MTTEIKFIASTLRCYTENEVLIIGLSNDPISPTHYIIISKFYNGEVGIQTHLREIEVSNAIKNVTLEKNAITIEIKDNKYDEVYCKKITGEFTKSPLEGELLKEYINKIFCDSSVDVMFKL